jgi:glycerol-3-phosphate dehydrogenase
MTPAFDLLVIGCGINGAGIARDAAGRGLRVLVCEQDDLAQHTSGASSKLIHGGLRYLEHYEFRLVGEALSEREVLMGLAPHLVRPLEFVMPHVPELRPAWMIRAGLFLYDRLGRRQRLPPSRAVDIAGGEYGTGLREDLARGFVYSDCCVDDARLVVLNALSARELGARVLTRTRCVSALRTRDHWEAKLVDVAGRAQQVAARALVNAAGPWVQAVHTGVMGQPETARVKEIKGSHIVVRRLYPGEHAFILQNSDKRVVFMIPYERDYTLIGTTDVEVPQPDDAAASDTEVDYLCAAVNRYLLKPIGPGDAVWRYSGVRPLYDDGSRDPSSVTRDYTLVYDETGGAPFLSVFGGKITTYRRLAEHVLRHFGKRLAGVRGEWTATTPLPGGDLPRGDLRAFVGETLTRVYPWLGPPLARALALRHGTNMLRLLRGVRGMSDLGQHFGDTLYAAEVDYLMEEEWARSAEDVLWRRTKCGLHLSAEQAEAVAVYVRERSEG